MSDYQGHPARGKCGRRASRSRRDPLPPRPARVYSGGVVTDLDEVRRLGTAKAAENVAFRRYMSAHHAGDKQFQILANDVQQHVNCTACANCCRDSVVSVDKQDIEAISRRLGVTPDAVARLYTVPDREAPALRILANSRRACIFLKGNLCQIYSARPKACRDFPHVSVGNHSLGARAASLARWAARCPIVYNALEDYKHLAGYHPHRPAA